jgi:GntR family transcriptional regulator / MocR family aminotransferase
MIFFKGAAMLPIISLKSDKALYEQLYEFYKATILSGRLKKGYRLPSHRTLAKELEVSNNTVIRAYEQLVDEGYLNNVARKGLFVCKVESIDNNTKKVTSIVDKSNIHQSKKSKTKITLYDNVIDEHVFPLKRWRKMQQLALDSLYYQYDYKSEKSTLKDHLVKYLYYSRGVIATPSRIVIGAGMNTLFCLLALMLKSSHQTILFEEPGYPKSRTIFKLHNYHVKSIPVRKDGVDMAKLRKEKADLLYLTPSHQYPTGVIIPIDNRLQILKWAIENNAYIIEDDFDCEFRHKAKLIPSLQSIDKFNRVIYFGTFSNSIMPSLRIAYMVLPDKFCADLNDFEFLINTVPFTSQQTLSYFIEKGFWESHLRKMRRIYREKYYLTIQLLKNIFGNRISFNQSHAGLNILIQIKTTLSERELLNKAEKQGIIVTPASPFYNNQVNVPVNPQILFEFSGLTIEQIPKVIEGLYKAWFG